MAHAHPEEDERLDFGRLNIPADHPARDAQDTFWLTSPGWREGDRLLRTHTSAVQSRTYKLVGEGQLAPPFRRVVVGKVFRYEACGRPPSSTFHHQVEGFVVDRQHHRRHLVATIRTLLNAVLQRDDIEVRLAPESFFFFVEPGLRGRCAFGQRRVRQPLRGAGSSCSASGHVPSARARDGRHRPARWQGFAFRPSGCSSAWR